MCLAIPGRIESITGDESIERMARVDFGGVSRDICLAYVPEARVGDHVLVHVGFALSVIDEEEARRTLEYIREIGALEPPG